MMKKPWLQCKINYLFVSLPMHNKITWKTPPLISSSLRIIRHELIKIIKASVDNYWVGIMGKELGAFGLPGG